MLLLADDSEGWTIEQWVDESPELVISLGGVSGYDLRSLSRALDGVPFVSVLVTQCPPAGRNADHDHDHDHAHQGIEALVPLVHAARPRYLLHGHTYPETHEIVTEFPGVPGCEVHYVYSYKRTTLVI